jgi:ankyrin repeat protein/mono/diheme cytochrome c family protein
MKCLRAALAAIVCSALALVLTVEPHALGKPGITPVPCPQQEWQYGEASFDALPAAKAFFGRYDGGLYRIEIPDNWNGELVLYAHGYVANQGQNGLTLRVGNHTIREHLVKEGFAWAASSYRCNGYVPGHGLVDTMALVDLFAKSNGGRAPQRTYLTGTSMGGHVTILGLHEFPTAFAGGLAMCPAGPELFDFYAAVGAAAEAITGVQFKPDSVQQDTGKIIEQLGKPPDLTEKGRQLASVEIQISGGPRPFAVDGLASSGRFTSNISGSALAGIVTPQNRAVTNAHIKYVVDGGLGLTSDSLNQRVRRKAADPEYRGENTPYEEVAPFNGKIERPLLTMHGTGDLFVPIFLQQVLKRAVVSSGNEKLLAQRIYRIAGHCGFSQAEQIKALDDLVKWVRQGIKPDGDEVIGDLSNAGMKFTDPLRPNDPGGLTIKAAPSSQPQARIDFVRDVQPIFREHCYGCHGPSVHQNGFRLDRRADAMRGGTIPVIGRGDSGASRLYQRLIGNRFGTQMPPTGPLTPEQVDIIKQWIDQGADWPDQAAGETPPVPTPPLMRAVLYGDVAAVQRLLDEGADPDERNDAGATALMWAANDEAKTRLLLEYGADPNIQSDHGKTALFIAAGRRGGAPIVKLLLDYGAGVAVRAGRLNNPTNPLIEAANVGEAATIRLLLDHGADARTNGYVAPAFALRAHCIECFELLVPSLDQQSLNFVGLVDTPPVGNGQGLSTLLQRGLDAKTTDGDGRTILMRAAASDVVPTSVIKGLLARGADVAAKTPKGDRAEDFARMHGRTAIVDLLAGTDRAGARASTERSEQAPPLPAPAASPRAAVERSLPLLQQADVTFFRKSGCISCHNNSLTTAAVAAARAHGIRVDEEIAANQLHTFGQYVESWRERALQGTPIPGDSDTTSYVLVGLSAENYPPDEGTDAQVRILLRQRLANGAWHATAYRPPIESNDIEVTALSIRALQVYGMKNLRVESERAIQSAAAWLRAAQPTQTEERAFQLLGLSWIGAAKAEIQKAARRLIAEQRPDGGWAQILSLSSDAYATGEALVALEQSGALTPSDPIYRRGVDFLLKTQLADGSWFVKTRALPIQPYFESGFPHGRDQFISMAATNWATIALAAAVRPAS